MLYSRVGIKQGVYLLPLLLRHQEPPLPCQVPSKVWPIESIILRGVLSLPHESQSARFLKFKISMHNAHGQKQMLAFSTEPPRRSAVISGLKISRGPEGPRPGKHSVFNFSRRLKTLATSITEINHL